ncbi:MAG: 2-oxo acid dehydrogenase subunit E2 [Candidatus Binatia bacterium]
MSNIPVLMPKLGQAMTAGTVQQWYHQAGDRVQQGEILVTIETDKATYDIEAPASGTLHIHVQEGQEVPIGTAIGEIGEAIAQPVTVPVSPASPPSSTTSVRSPTRRKILASPKAKQLAAEQGIDLATITPASADGVISAADVEKALVARLEIVPPTAPPSDGTRGVRERRPLTGIRKTAARRVQEAWQTIPHIVQMVDVDATNLLAARAALRTEIASLTVNDLILHAAAQVMVQLPELNGAVEADTLVLYDGVDVGFAVDTPRGLVVPVIRRADTLSVPELVNESQRLIEAARAGRLSLENIGNASLTVSNLGMFGIRFGTPVINLGEPLLVFVGAVEERPVADHGQVVIRPMMTLSIGYDHRVADGVAASRFTQGLKERLESSVQYPASKFQILNPSPQPLAPSLVADLQRRELRTTSDKGYAVQVQSRGHAWGLDEPTDDGGTDTGPDPVSSFLGALLSCMTISFKAAARRRKVTVERVRGHVQATPQGHVKNIAMTLEVWSPDPEENVRALLEGAKRGCYVSGVLKPEIECRVELVVVAV